MKHEPMAIRTTLALLFLFVTSCEQKLTGQDVERAHQLATSYATQYVHPAGPVGVERAPDPVVDAFQLLEKEDQETCTKLLELIFLRAYHAHLECCHQSYELRTGRSFSGIDELADPLLAQFVRCCQANGTIPSYEFLSSELSFEFARKVPDLLGDPLIKAEYEEILLLHERIKSGEFWKDQ